MSDDSSTIKDLKDKIALLEAENLELKQNKTSIEKARDFYLKIFDDFPALIWRSRLDKKCDYFNHTWLDFTGRTFEQEFGDGWAEGVHPDDLQKCFEIYVQSFDQRKPFEMEYRLKNKQGEYRWIRDIGRPFYDLNNEFIGYIGSCYDITDNKNNLFQLEELNATKNLFFSIIAHDLRNPITIFSTFIDMLKSYLEEKNEMKIKEILELIKTVAVNNLNLLENLLLWANTQTKGISFSPKKINLDNLVQENISLAQSQAFHKQISLLTFYPKDLFIYADKEMISTILRNLISNAIKFSFDQSKVELHVVKKDLFTVFSVIDSGIGISQNEIDNLFLVSKKHKRQGTKGEIGTGLGLILCKEFVDKHGGKIWIESEVSKGSKINFSIPDPI